MHFKGNHVVYIIFMVISFKILHYPYFHILDCNDTTILIFFCIAIVSFPK